MTNLLKLSAALAALSLTPAAAADQDHAGSGSSSESPRAFVLGARLGTLAGNGDLPVVRGYNSRVGGRAYTWNEQSWESSGTAVDGEVGLRFARAWSLFAGWELGTSTADHLGAVRFTTHAPHVGVRLTTNRQSVTGFVLEMGAGYRVIAIDRDGDVSFASGFEPLRAGVGLTFAIRAVRINAMFSVAAGQLTTLDAYGNSRELTGDSRRFHAFRSLTIGGTFDL